MSIGFSACSAFLGIFWVFRAKKTADFYEFLGEKSTFLPL